MDQSKRQTNFEEMEDRIKRMESAIITSQLHGISGLHHETAEQIVEAKEEEKEEKSSSDKIESQAEISDHLSNLVLDCKGSTSFIGV